MVETVRAVLDRLEKTKVEAVIIGPNGNSLDLLRAVYQNNDLPLATRMRAAMACLKHEVPALIATAVVNEGSFAELLERRLQRFEQMKLIEASEVTEVASSTNGSEPTNGHQPQAQPLARIYTNKFRRRL